MEEKEKKIFRKGCRQSPHSASNVQPLPLRSLHTVFRALIAFIPSSEIRNYISQGVVTTNCCFGHQSVYNHSGVIITSEEARNVWYISHHNFDSPLFHVSPLFRRGRCRHWSAPTCSPPWTRLAVDRVYRSAPRSATESHRRLSGDSTTAGGSC